MFLLSVPNIFLSEICAFISKQGLLKISIFQSVVQSSRELHFTCSGIKLQH